MKCAVERRPPLRPRGIDWEEREGGWDEVSADVRQALSRLVQGRPWVVIVALVGAIGSGVRASRRPERSTAHTVLFVLEGPEADRFWVAPTRSLRSRVDDAAWTTAPLAELGRSMGLRPIGGADDRAYARAVRERTNLEVDRNEFGEPGRRDRAPRAARITIRVEDERDRAGIVASRLGRLVADELARADLQIAAARHAAFERAVERARAELALGDSALASARSDQGLVESDALTVSSDRWLSASRVRAARRLDELQSRQRHALRLRLGDRRRSRWVDQVDRGLEPRSVDRRIVGAASGIAGGLGSLLAMLLAMTVLRGIARWRGDSAARRAAIFDAMEARRSSAAFERPIESTRRWAP